MLNRAYLGLFLVLLVVSLGCGSGKVGLTGKVTFSDDNSPITAGAICFEGSDGKTGRAEIKPDGTYRAGFDGDGDGLPKGTYKVYLTGVARVETDATGMNTSIPIIDPKYSSVVTSGLSFVADGKVSTYDISVDRLK